MNLARVTWLVGVAILVMILNVAASILYMVVYSYLINPGHDKEYYEDHAQDAAPYCSIVIGIPLMFLAGYWISGWRDGESAIRSALVVWLVYAVIDVSIVLAAGPTSRIAMLVALSMITKLAAIYFGVVARRRNVETM